MKKKALILFVVTLFSAILALGCSQNGDNGYTPDPYTGFNGYDPAVEVPLEDFITIDGVLDEDIWTNCKTEIEIAGATKDSLTGLPVDVETYGERSATVYAYIGEECVYFAVDVKDKNLYWNIGRAQGQNTCVEINVAPSGQVGFMRGCYSFRYNPKGTGVDPHTVVYEPKYLNGVASHLEANKNNTWAQKGVVPGWTKAATVVNGQVMTSADQKDEYSTENNEGYVLEVAINKKVLGGANVKDLLFTVSFSQARDFNTNRIGNSYIKGTTYINPATWKVLTNDGVIADEDKEAYLDATVDYDDDLITIDGLLHDDIWDDAIGRTVVSNVKRSVSADEKEYLETTTYAVTTDKGVYIGIKTNDANAYHHDDSQYTYNTGAEVLIHAGKTNKINPRNTKQIRFNVAGPGRRYNGNDPTKDVYAYSASYFPAKMAGAVLGGLMNTSTADGWSGEIFIPWTSLGIGKTDYRNGIAVLVNPYRAYEDSSKKQYISAVEGVKYGYDGLNCFPQDDWFLFRDNAPLCSVNLDDIALTKTDLKDGYYQANVSAVLYDDVVTRTGFFEKFDTLAGGSFSFADENGVIVTEDGNGNYFIKIPADKAEAFEDGKNVVFTCGTHEKEINVSVESEIAIDGILDEDIWSGVNKLSTTQTTNGITSTNDFTVILRDSAMYLSANITDANFDAFRDKLALGLELCIYTGKKTITTKNMYQLRITSNASEALTYKYVESNPPSDWPWIQIGTNANVKFAFVSDNNGGYVIEAKIPYTVIGLDEKPENVQIAPFTAFVTNASTETGAKGAKLFNWGGGTYTDEIPLFHKFDENGFAPDKVVLVNEFDRTIETLPILMGMKMEEEKYVGEINVSLYPDNVMPVLDANFGEYNEYFTNLGNGKYAYAIPAELIAENVDLLVPITSAGRKINVTFHVVPKRADSLYASAEGINLFTSTLVDGYYVFETTITADEFGEFPVEEVSFINDCEAVEKGNGVYEVRVKKDFAESSNARWFTIKAVIKGFSVQDNFMVTYNGWTEEELASVRSYLNFDDNIDDVKGANVTVGTGSSPTYVEGTTGKGIKLQNPDKEDVGAPKNNLNLKQSLGTEDFSIAFDLKLDSNAIGKGTTTAAYEIVQSGDNVDTGSDTFQLSAYDNGKKSIGFRIQLSDRVNDSSRVSTYYFDNLDLPVDEYFNFVLVVDREYKGTTETEEKVSVSVYINGVIKKTNEMRITIVDGQLQTLGNGNLALGGDYWTYDGGHRYLEMDNFLLYGGKLTQTQITTIASVIE